MIKKRPKAKSKRKGLSPRYSMSTHRVSAKDKRNADRFIDLLKHFQIGCAIQRKTWESDWNDINLAELIGQRAVHYRIKP